MTEYHKKEIENLNTTVKTLKEHLFEKNIELERSKKEGYTLIEQKKKLELENVSLEQKMDQSNQKLSSLRGDSNEQLKTKATELEKKNLILENDLA